MKKIVFINQTLGIGGAETFNADLLESLQKDQNITIEVYTTNNRFAEMLQQRSINTKKITTIIDIIGNWKGLLKGIVLFPIAIIEYGLIAWKVRDTDLILMSGYPEKLLIAPWAYIFNIPVIWLEFGPMKKIFQKFYGLPKFLYDLSRYSPNTVIVPTDNTKRHLQSETLINHTLLKTIPCGRNITTSYKITESKDPIITCVSRMELGKGQELLVQALPKILVHYPKTVVQFIGEGDHIETVKKAVKQRKLEKSVQFLNFVPDVMPYLASSTVCVFPSVWSLEGFGMVMIEAMALGKPVVAFNRGPAPEIIQDKVTGLLAKAGDTNDLAEKILTLLHSKKLRTSYGKAGIAAFEKKYTIKQISKQYLKTFEETIQ